MLYSYEMKIESEKEIFQRDGIVCLRGAVAKDKVSAAKSEIFRQLERLKYRTDGKWQTRTLDELQPFSAISKVSQAVGYNPLFDQLMTKELIEHACSLADLKLKPEQTQPQLLVTLPQKKAWSVPHLGWHVDIAEPKDRGIPGVQIFVLIADLSPRGGGTIVVAGAHRFREFNPAATSPMQALKEDPHFSDLFNSGPERERFMKPKDINGTSLRVMEMAGKAGDAYVMDMRLPHAPSVNATKDARMMLTSRFIRP